MPDAVVVLAAVVVGLVLAPLLRSLVVRGKRRRYESGRATRIHARARGPAPFPRRFAWGTVRVGDGAPAFHRWLRPGPAAPLTGLALVGKHVTAHANSSEELVVFRLRGGVDVVEVAVPVSEAALFERLLDDVARGEQPTTRPAPRAPRWRIVAAALGVAWLLAWAYAALAGTVLDATVLANDDDLCQVEWSLDGRYDTAEVDCFGQRPGEAVRIVALPWPVRGQAVDVVVTRVVVPLVALVSFAPLALHGLRRRRDDRREPPPLPPQPVVPFAEGVPKLDRHELRYSRIAETVTRRAEVEEWGEQHVPWWLRPFPTPHARLLAASVMHATLFPGITLVLATGVGFTALETGLRFEPGAARETESQVTGVYALVPPLPHEVTVEVREGDRPRRLVVYTLREPREGDPLTIRQDGGVARAAAGNDGLPRALLLYAVVAGGALAVLGWRLAGVVRYEHAARRLRTLPPVPMRYAVTRDVMGVPVMLLFDVDGDPRPTAAVGFAWLPPDVPVTGTAEVQGTPADGELVVVRAGGHLLFPNDVVAELGTAALRDFVNGDLVDLCEYEDEPG